MVHGTRNTAKHKMKKKQHLTKLSSIITFAEAEEQLNTQDMQISTHWIICV